MPDRSIHLREQHLPGVGQLFEIDLADGRRLEVIATRDGGRTVGVGDPSSSEADAPTVMLKLSSEEAVMVGALLLGARLTVDAVAEHQHEGDTVTVETITVSDGAACVGRSVREVVGSLGDDVAVLGVVRDRTPDIVETDRDSPLAAGDRVVIASRPGRLETVAALLTVT